MALPIGVISENFSAEWGRMAAERKLKEELQAQQYLQASEFLTLLDPVALSKRRLLEVWDDDGSKEWADLYERLQKGPMREQRS